MNISSSRPGYVFLISVLAVGAIVTLIVSVLLLLATTVTRSIISLEQSARALEYAHVCAERTLDALHTNPEHVGGNTISLEYGTCTVGEIGGIGNVDRHFCITAVSGEINRIFEVSVKQLLPILRIRSWQEVAGCISTS